jgi:hypothetical protein
MGIGRQRDRDLEKGMENQNSQERKVSENFCPCCDFFISALQSSNDMMRDWMDQRDMFIHEMLSIEAPPKNTTCGSCRQVTGIYRCSDCQCSWLFCKACCLKDHIRHPFHTISEWNGNYFITTSLQNLGFVLHVGHEGSECPKAQEYAEGEFTVVDIAGVYHHRLSWCRCSDAPSRSIQLLQRSLYPSTVQYPRTAFTFRLLRYYHVEVMECGSTPSSFMTKLQRVTNPHHPNTVKVSQCHLVPYEMWMIDLI